jgi:hypothetical protein
MTIEIKNNTARSHTSRIITLASVIFRTEFSPPTQRRKKEQTEKGETRKWGYKVCLVRHQSANRNLYRKCIYYFNRKQSRVWIRDSTSALAGS